MRARSLRGVFRSVPLIGLLTAQVILSPPAHAAAGDLDPSFGSGGVVTTDLGGDDEILAIALQPDGKIVTAGEIYYASSGGSDFVVARYGTSGSLDPTFGSGGVAITDFGGRIDIATGVALQPDGKIVVVGRSQSGADDATNDFAIARYTSTGSLDPTFGSGGEVLTDFGGQFDAPWGGVVIQSDGKIVAGGTVNSDATGFIADFGVARYDTDGSLDPAFGQGGEVITNIDDHHASAGAMVLQPNGRIVLAGGSLDGLALARYMTDGSLDPSFGSGGVAADISIGTGAEGLALAPSGKLIAVGRVAVGGSGFASDIAVERVNGDGSLDSTFGSGGRVTTDIGDEDFAPDVAIQPDGKVVVGGNSFGTGGTWNIVVARYNPDGSLDAGFGTGGISLSKPFGDLVAIALQPDGKILAGGIGSGGVGEDMALARYLGDRPIVSPAPQISGFSPHSGPVGTMVTIVGANLEGATSLTFDDTSQPSFSVNGTGTTITATVPADATSGPIHVWTPLGEATSGDAFIVTIPTTHVRGVTFGLWGHLRVSGIVSAADAFAACSQGAAVEVQRHRWFGWHTVATFVADSYGTFRGQIPDRAGTYRAKVWSTTLANGDTCSPAVSPRRHHGG